MNVAFEARFARDLKRLRDQSLLRRVQQVIEQVKAASELNEIRSLKKMQGYETLYDTFPKSVCPLQK